MELELVLIPIQSVSYYSRSHWVIRNYCQLNKKMMLRNTLLKNLFNTALLLSLFLLCCPKNFIALSVKPGLELMQVPVFNSSFSFSITVIKYVFVKDSKNQFCLEVNRSTISFYGWIWFLESKATIQFFG